MFTKVKGKQMNVSLRQLPGDGMGREWGSLAWRDGTGEGRKMGWCEGG